jgi:hypothetical protein
MATTKQIHDAVERLDMARSSGKPMPKRALTNVEIAAMPMYITRDSVGAAFRLLNEVQRLRKRASRP